MTLSGDRDLTLPMAHKITEALGYPPDVQESFVGLVINRHRAKMGSKNGKDKKNIKLEDKFQFLTMDAFSVISDWYHYAITELTFLENSKSDPRWIAKALGISYVEAKAAVNRLLRLGLLEKDAQGRLRKTTKPLSSTHDTPSSALKKFHKQVLQKAMASLDEVPVEKRDVTSMTMAIDPAKLPEAKKKISKFRRSLCAFLESGDQKQVYNLGIQLFPLSKLELKDGEK